MKSSIALKIAVGFISVIVLMALMLWIGRWGYNNVLDNVNNLEALAAKQTTAGNLRIRTAQLLMAVNDYILTGKDVYREDYTRLNALIDTHAVQLRMQMLEPVEKRIITSILLDIDSIRAVSKRVFTMKSPRSSSKAIELMEYMDHNYGRRVNQKTTELFDHISKRIDEERKNVSQVKTRTSNINFLVLLLGGLISLIFIYLTMKRIAKPIVTVTQDAHDLAQGDYSYRPVVKTHDEVAELTQPFSTMTDNIQRAQRALEHSKRLNESIVHSIPLGIILFDAEAKILSVNKRVEELFNIESGELVRSQVEAFLEHIGMSGECREAIISKKPVKNLVCRCECPRLDQEMWLSLTLTTFTVPSDSNGECHQYLLVVNDISEQQAAVKALEESERRLSTLIHNLPGVAYRCKNDPDWTVEYFSEGCYDLTGYPIDTFLYNAQKSYNDIIHPEDRVLIWDTVQRKLQERQPYQLTYRILTADGQTKWVWEQGQGVYDEEGNLSCLEGFITDITDQKHAEAIIHESEKRYRLLFEQSVEAIYLCDAKTLQIKEANSAFLHLLGYTEEEVRNLTIFDIVAEDRKNIQGVINRLSTEGSSTIGERRWKKKDGSIVNVDVTVSTFSQRGERTIYVIARDITERKKIEKALQENEQRYRSVVESLTQAYYETDSRGIFMYFNQGLLLIGGYDEKELRGTSVFRCVIPEHRQRVIAAYLQLIKEKRADVTIDFIVQTKSGRRFWVEQISHLTYDSDGNFIKATNTLRDITERKLAEQKLQDLNKQLELALKYQELFIANMTHEIRTPLNVILGYTGYIRDIGSKNFTPEEAELFDSIESAGERLMRTVDNVLQLTSFQTGLTKINPQRLNLSPVVQGIVREMWRQASDKGLSLEIDTLEEPLYAVCDRYSLEQAIVNLIDNAIKYTSTGGIVVNLKRMDDHAHIEVHDTGIGISEEFLPKIFTAFSQESTGYTRAYQGLGLGLSLVKNYISATGGTISVQSKKGEGSVFSIVFPLA